MEEVLREQQPLKHNSHLSSPTCTLKHPTSLRALRVEAAVVAAVEVEANHQPAKGIRSMLEILSQVLITFYLCRHSSKSIQVFMKLKSFVTQ